MEEPEEKNKCRVCLSGCKQVTTFILSHVGLVTLVVGYCLIGAAVFEKLEADHEKSIKRNMTQIRKAVSDELWMMTKGADLIVPEEWAANASKKLAAFELVLLNAMKKKGWDGVEDEDVLQWSFTGALFYSIVVITTIGYGHIAPKTSIGKIVTIFYAIIGIPLMVVCWSNLGDFMANAFRFLYWKVCCYVCTRKPKPRRGPMRRGRSVRGPPSRASGSARMKRSIRRSARISQRSADSAMSDSVISTSSDPCFMTGLEQGVHIQRHSYNSSTLPRTTQPRQFQPQKYMQRSTKSAEPECPMHLRNLPVLYNKYAQEVVITQQPTVAVTPDFDVEEEMMKPRLNRMRSAPPERFLPRGEELDYWEEEDEDYDDDEYDEIDPGSRPVPIWLCAFLVLSYIIGGAYLFSNWEPWGFLDSAYFCFITLTTIGFGDFVPSQSQGNSYRPEVSIALCSLYLLFGIALLAMSFNLVQEQVINSVKQVAIRLGIINEEEA
ncbi:unnamed protein product [Allacma fusca]|uniref:Potassium channel domain-containing protein n=1 Tax=Allacma fusca TaxID=39272 RepID=A0A8J2K488_9HEXA|nr:unnamed protein product [Allacma fusca]